MRWIFRSTGYLLQKPWIDLHPAIPTKSLCTRFCGIAIAFINSWQPDTYASLRKTGFIRLLPMLDVHLPHVLSGQYPLSKLNHFWIDLNCYWLNSNHKYRKARLGNMLNWRLTIFNSPAFSDREKGWFEKGDLIFQLISVSYIVFNYWFLSIFIRLLRRRYKAFFLSQAWSRSRG